MIFLKLLALIATVLTGGAVASELAQKHAAAQRLANVVAMVAAIYLLRDIWHDVKSLGPIAGTPNPPTPESAPNVQGPVILKNDYVVTGWSWKSAVLLISACLISGFLATLRGLTREFLSLGSWAFAGLVTLYVYSADWFNGLFESHSTIFFVVLSGVFIVSLILFSLVVANISERILDSRVGAFDRTMGLIYGLMRGVVLVSIAAMLGASLFGEEAIYGKLEDPIPVPLNVIKYIDHSIRSNVPLSLSHPRT